MALWKGLDLIEMSIMERRVLVMIRDIVDQRAPADVNTPITLANEWKQLFTNDVRHFIVLYVAQSLFRFVKHFNEHDEILLDRRFRQFLSFIAQEEKRCFNMADHKEDYYRSLKLLLLKMSVPESPPGSGQFGPRLLQLSMDPKDANQRRAAQGDDPASSQGDDPVSSQGDDPASSQGDDPANFQGDPASSKDDNVSSNCDKTAISLGDATSSPGDKDISSIGDDPASSHGDHPASPHGDDPTSPHGDKATSPNGDPKSSDDKPGRPRGDELTRLHQQFTTSIRLDHSEDIYIPRSPADDLCDTRTKQDPPYNVLPLNVHTVLSDLSQRMDAIQRGLLDTPDFLDHLPRSWQSFIFDFDGKLDTYVACVQAIVDPANTLRLGVLVHLFGYNLFFVPDVEEMSAVSDFVKAQKMKSRAGVANYERGTLEALRMYPSFLDMLHVTMCVSGSLFGDIKARIYAVRDEPKSKSEKANIEWDIKEMTKEDKEETPKELFADAKKLVQLDEQKADAKTSFGFEQTAGCKKSVHFEKRATGAKKSVDLEQIAGAKKSVDVEQIEGAKKSVDLEQIAGDKKSVDVEQTAGAKKSIQFEEDKSVPFEDVPKTAENIYARINAMYRPILSPIRRPADSKHQDTTDSQSSSDDDSDTKEMDDVKHLKKLSSPVSSKGWMTQFLRETPDSPEAAYKMDTPSSPYSGRRVEVGDEFLHFDLADDIDQEYDEDLMDLSWADEFSPNKFTCESKNKKVDHWLDSFSPVKPHGSVESNQELAEAGTQWAEEITKLKELLSKFRVPEDMDQREEEFGRPEDSESPWFDQKGSGCKSSTSSPEREIRHSNIYRFVSAINNTRYSTSLLSYLPILPHLDVPKQT